MRKAALAMAVLCLAACDRGPILRDPGKDFRVPRVIPPRPTQLDGAYEPKKWEWQLQPENNYLLTHKSVPNCHVAVDWPMEILDSENKPKPERSEKKFGSATYDIVSIKYPDGMQELHYVRSNKERLHIAVFGTNACRTEAERIVRTVEANARGRTSATP
jgi:hypothetical protein